MNEADTCEKPDFWNLFRTSFIVDVVGTVSGSVEIFLQADFRRTFPQTGNQFIVRLNHCTFVEYEDWISGQTFQDFDLLRKHRPQVLDALPDGDLTTINCDRGILRTRYSIASIFLDFYVPVPHATFQQKVIAYWQTFENEDLPE